MYVRATGVGAPMVFIHGAGGSGQLFAKQFQAFRDYARCYFIDLPGHGKSGGISDPGISSYAAVVAAFLATLSSPVRLVGHSMGGAIGLEIALSQRKLVSELILIGTGCRLSSPRNLLDGLQTDYDATIREIVESSFAKDADPELLRRAVAAIEMADPATVRADFHSCAVFNACSRLGELDIPSLIISGSADEMTPPGLSEELHVRIKNSRLEIISDGSHMMMLEQPVVFNALLLASIGAPSP